MKAIYLLTIVLLLLPMAPLAQSRTPSRVPIICDEGEPEEDSEYDYGIDMFTYGYVDGVCNSAGTGWDDVHHDWDFGTVGQQQHLFHKQGTYLRPDEGQGCVGSGCAYTKEKVWYSNNDVDYYLEADSYAVLIGY